MFYLISELQEAEKVEGDGVRPFPAVVQCHHSAVSWSDAGNRAWQSGKSSATENEIKKKKWGEIKFKQVEK